MVLRTDLLVELLMAQIDTNKITSKKQTRLLCIWLIFYTTGIQAHQFPCKFYSKMEFIKKVQDHMLFSYMRIFKFIILTWQPRRTSRTVITSVNLLAVVTNFMTSAPVDCILAINVPSSSADGVFWKLWLDTMILQPLDSLPRKHAKKSVATYKRKHKSLN